MTTRGIRGLTVFCAFGLVACGDDANTSASGSGTMTSGVTAGTTDGGVTTTVSSTSGASEGSATDGSASASASASGTTTGPTTGATDSNGTTTTTTATTDPMTSGSSTNPVMTGSSGGGDTTGGLPPGVCGDGVLNPGEQCDDGANNGPDKDCYEDCTANVCGDGVLGSMEECDLAAMNGPDNGCSVDCKILPSACGNQSAQAVLTKLPVDIIFVIDNSGSMSAEIKGVQDNINKNFAQIIESSGIDYRVIMLSRFGKYTSTQICVEAPLGGIPMGGCVNPPAQPVNTAKFFHYSYTIASTDSWCRILNTLKGGQKDTYNLAPNGWITWLRPDSFKTFVEVTDDRVSCSYNGKTYNDGGTEVAAKAAATNFDTDLRAASTAMFGMTPPAARNYNFYGLIGVPYNMPPEEPYSAKDPIFPAATKCPSAVNSGMGHQALSNMTDALRGPLCDPTKYDAIFQSIAQGVVSSAKVACKFTIPDAPMGKILDQDSITVDYLPMGNAMNQQTFKQVAGPMQCDAMSFYVMGNEVILCPDACTAVQGDPGAKIDVNFTCEPLKPN